MYFDERNLDDLAPLFSELARAMQQARRDLEVRAIAQRFVEESQAAAERAGFLVGV